MWRYRLGKTIGGWPDPERADLGQAVVIDNEDKNNPLNDDEIVDKLREQGIELARRTVAKYRKILNIPTARQRKQF